MCDLKTNRNFTFYILWCPNSSIEIFRLPNRDAQKGFDKTRTNTSPKFQAQSLKLGPRAGPESQSNQKRPSPRSKRTKQTLILAPMPRFKIAQKILANIVVKYFIIRSLQLQIISFILPKYGIRWFQKHLGFTS